ncbi:hypothetical protein M2317_002932 [Microbacterium sp. ZKA21]|uniref:hypothetical protein n=1 Tax=Microbacterium sp. ZKA21 TaxID=3381694 RepID=UPI003D1D0F3B
MNTIQPDHWATETTVDDLDGEVPTATHTRDYVDGDFTVCLSHAIAEIDLGTDVLVKWVEQGATGGLTPEEFAVSVGNVPALIAVLQRAHALLTETEAERG